MRKAWVILLSVSVTVILGDAVTSEAAEAGVGIAKQGNLLYALKRFDKAIEKYDAALSEASEPETESLIYFNKGAALYKKGDFDRAIEAFTKAMATENVVLEAKANYNIGNCKYRLCELYLNVDTDSSIKWCREALYYYKWAIESEARIPNAIYNYEFAKKKLDYLLIKRELEEEKKKAQRYPRQGQESEKTPDSKQITSSRLDEEFRQQQKNLQNQKQSLKEQFNQGDQELSRKHQDQTQQIEEEFKQKQQKLTQQYQGQDLKDRLDRLNQEKNQKQQKLNQEYQNQQNQLKDQYQQQSQDLQQYQNQQFDKDWQETGQRLAEGLPRRYDDIKKAQVEIAPSQKIPLDEPPSIDYTGIESQPDREWQPQRTLSGEEAERLLDAYSREIRTSLKKRKKTAEGWGVRYKDW